MAEKKVTKKDMFDLIERVCGDNAQIVEFCQHEKELLTRKNSKSGTTKTQAENIKVGEMLIAELANIARPVTITELMASSEVVANYTLENGNKLTNQKISAIFKQLVDKNAIVRTSDKKKTYFSIGE